MRPLPSILNGDLASNQIEKIHATNVFYLGTNNEGQSQIAFTSPMGGGEYKRGLTPIQHLARFRAKQRRIMARGRPPYPRMGSLPQRRRQRRKPHQGNQNHMDTKQIDHVCNFGFCFPYFMQCEILYLKKIITKAMLIQNIEND